MAQDSGKFTVFVGTYTDRDSRGIYRFEFDAVTGAATEAVFTAETRNPSFLALHPTGRYLFAVNEIGEYRGEKAGSVTSYAIDGDSRALTAINEQSSQGAIPCHIVVDPAGRHVLLANYTGGSVAVLPVTDEGRLGPASSFIQHAGSGVNPQRQEGPHAHSINLDPTARFAIAADLGLDQVLVYRYDAERGTLAPNDPPFAAVPPGSGPRHFAFHPNGRFAYVINELLSTVTAFSWDGDRGVLTPLQTITTLPAGYTGNTTTAEVQVHPSGKFLYGSNRGHDSIASFRVDSETGRLTATGQTPIGGWTPRNFGIDPTGKYLLAAGQDTDAIRVFRIDASSGALTDTGNVVRVPRPVCIKFLAR